MSRFFRAAGAAFNAAKSAHALAAFPVVVFFNNHEEKAPDGTTIHKLLERALPALKDTGVKRVLLELPNDMTLAEMSEYQMKYSKEQYESLNKHGFIAPLIEYSNRVKGTSYKNNWEDAVACIEGLSFDERKTILREATKGKISEFNLTNAAHVLTWLSVKDKEPMILARAAHKVLGEEGVVHADLPISDDPASDRSMEDRDRAMSKEIMYSIMRGGETIGVFGIAHCEGRGDRRDGIKGRLGKILEPDDLSNVVLIYAYLGPAVDEKNEARRKEYHALQDKDDKAKPKDRDPLLVHTFEAETDVDKFVKQLMDVVERNRARLAKTPSASPATGGAGSEALVPRSDSRRR